MIGMLYRTKRSKHIYACININHTHIPIFTMICITDGDKWVVEGFREFDRHFEPLTIP